MKQEARDFSRESKFTSYLLEGITFNHETTLCGHSILRTICRAKQSGYLIEMHYVGVDSPETAKQRIAQRVRMGGHGIPDKDVERRYGESLKNLHVIIGLCDLAALYDNTDSFRGFAIYKSGGLVRQSKNIPEWYRKWQEEYH